MQVPAIRESTNVDVHLFSQENPQFNVDVLILQHITSPVSSERL